MFMQDSILQISTDFFTKLWVDYSDLWVEEENDKIFRVKIKSNDSNLLIGPHWKNLEVIAHLLKILISKSIQEHVHIHFEVNDYLEKKDEKLFSFIQSKIDLVNQTGKDMILPFFTAYERKKVHWYVGEKWKNIFTQSVGEGKDRRMHLCKKEEKITIDIDGSDI